MIKQKTGVCLRSLGLEKEKNSSGKDGEAQKGRKGQKLEEGGGYPGSLVNRVFKLDATAN